MGCAMCKEEVAVQDGNNNSSQPRAPAAVPKAGGGGVSFRAQGQFKRCQLPGCIEFVYVDTRRNKVFDHCSKAHAELDSKSQQRTSPPQAEILGGLLQEKCSLPGCEKLCAFDKTKGIVYDYCTIEHAKAASSNVRDQKHAPPGTGKAVDITRNVLKGSFQQAGKPPPSSSQESSAPLPAPGISPACHLLGCSKPCHVDLKTGQRFDHCCKSHALEAKQLGATPSSSAISWGQVPDSERCTLPGCGERKSPGFDHCCRSHAIEARKYSPMCTLSGCLKSAWFDPKRQEYSPFCSNSHRLQGERVLKEISAGSGNSRFRLHLLDQGHHKYISVKNQFTTTWKKSPTAPSVENIFLIKMPPDIFEKYNAYRNKVGNERRRFHGTVRASNCNFFAGLQARPCGVSTCVACNICMIGFKLSGTNQKSFARFGRGLYFSSVSGKSNDYAVGSEQSHGGVRYRTMFLCHVAVGKPKITEEGSLQHNECPGQGFDSVVGNKGAYLNYPETVVYKEEAALPMYMIVYRV